MIDIFYFFLHNLSPLLMNPFVSLPFASFLFFLKGKSLGYICLMAEWTLLTAAAWITSLPEVWILTAALGSSI